MKKHRKCKKIIIAFVTVLFIAFVAVIGLHKTGIYRFDFLKDIYKKIDFQLSTNELNIPQDALSFSVYDIEQEEYLFYEGDSQLPTVASLAKLFAIDYALGKVDLEDIIMLEGVFLKISNIEWIEKLDCLTDLHVHLDGSLSLESVRHLCDMQNIETGDEIELSEKLSVSSDCKNLNEYLEKFEFPLQLLQTREAVKYSVCQLVKEQEEQGVIYSEIRFAPQLHTRKGLSQQEIVEAACEGLDESRKYWKSYSCHNLILCCMRSDDNKDANMETVRLAALYAERGRGVVAADLAGAEGLYATDTFADVFRDAVQRGVPFTIHAGEAAGAESVECALNFQAVRIGHGVRSTENPLIMQELADRETALELCPTSNLNTKIYDTIENYPIQKLMNKGIKVTVNTDNMMVSNTTEARELALVADTFNMEKKDVKKLIMNGVEAAFTTEGIKNRLRARVETQFAKVAGIRG